MEEERQRTPIYKIAGVAGAGLIVVLAAVWVVAYGPVPRHETPTERLATALAARFPGSEPEVTRADTETLRIALKVGFDPTVDADQAQGVFQRALQVAKAEPLSGVKAVEVSLEGVSLEGGPTSQSRTFGLTAGSQESGARSQKNGEADGRSEDG
jgi:hypothetical protein